MDFIPTQINLTLNKGKMSKEAHNVGIYFLGTNTWHGDADVFGRGATCRGNYAEVISELPRLSPKISESEISR
ncbi:hypothetical protein CsSME_00049716 [Camellia sinensis var. sinensis]